MNSKKLLRNKHKTPPTKSASKNCNKELCRDGWLSQVHIIAGYLAKEDEIDIQPFIDHALKAGKTICLPRYHPQDDSYQMAIITNLKTQTQPGKFNIQEPTPNQKTIPIHQIQAWCIPGLAFDWQGNRLGRGKGVYDKLLSQSKGVKIGITTKSRMEPRIPSEPHDIKMDMLVVEDSIRSVLR